MTEKTSLTLVPRGVTWAKAAAGERAGATRGLLTDLLDLMTELLALESASREVLLEALIDFHRALSATPPYDERLDGDSPLATALLAETGLHLGYLVRVARTSGSGPGAVSTAPSPNAPGPSGGTPDEPEKEAQTGTEPEPEPESRADDGPGAPGGGGSGTDDTGIAAAEAADHSPGARTDSAEADSGTDTDTGTKADRDPGGTGLAMDTGAESGSESKCGSGSGSGSGSKLKSGSGSGSGSGSTVAAPPRKPAKPLPGRKTAPGPGDRLIETLTRLHTELTADPELRPWLGAPAPTLTAGVRTPPPVPRTVDAHWVRCHMALLRVEPEQRLAWHRRLREAMEAEGVYDALRADAPPGPDPDESIDDPDVLVPALPGHFPVERLSLRSGNDLPLGPEVPEKIRTAARVVTGGACPPDPSSPEARRRLWALRAARILRLIQLDPLLTLRWKGINRAAPAAALEYYPGELITELGRLVSTQEGGWSHKDRFMTEHALDALIGSVLHPTPPAPGSWWWRWRSAPWPEMSAAARRGGFEFPLNPGDLRVREEVLRLTKGNVAGRSGAAANLVQWVLYAPARHPDDAGGVGAVVILPENEG